MLSRSAQHAIGEELERGKHRVGNENGARETQMVIQISRSCMKELALCPSGSSSDDLKRWRYSIKKTPSEECMRACALSAVGNGLQQTTDSPHKYRDGARCLQRDSSHSFPNSSLNSSYIQGQHGQSSPLRQVRGVLADQGKRNALHQESRKCSCRSCDAEAPVPLRWPCRL